MALRNITLTYGELVSLPLKKMGAIEEGITFKNLCVGQPGKPAHAPSPRKQPYVCIHCGPLAYDAPLVKGVEEGDGFRLVAVEDVAETKAEFAGEHKGVISLVTHPAGPFYANTAPGESVSYLIPGSAVIENQYATLAAFITEHPDVVFVGLHTPQSVTSLYQVTVRGGVLVLEQRKRSQELRELPSVGGEPMTKLGAFLDMILEETTTDYDAETYEDKYAAAIAALVEASEVVEADAAAVPDKPAPKAKGMSDAQMAEKLAALSTTPPKARATKSVAKRSTTKGGKAA